MKVVIAVEDSQYSQDVIEEVIKRHWPKDTYFKILTVVEPIDPQTLRGNPGLEVVRTAQEHRRHAAEKLCSAFRQKLLEHIVDSIVHFEIGDGLVKDEIIRVATQWEADKIVLGANTGLRTEFKRTGGNCKSVVDRARCGVEIIVPTVHRRARKEESQLAS